MNAAIEDALVNWYEVERSARWSASEAQHNNIVHIEAARPKPSAALDALFRAVEDALDTLSMRPFASAELRAAPLMAPLQAGLGA